MRLGLCIGDPGGMTLRYAVTPLLGVNSCVTRSLRTLRFRFSVENNQVKSPVLRLSFLLGDPGGMVAWTTRICHARNKFLRVTHWRPHPLRGLKSLQRLTKENTPSFDEVFSLVTPAGFEPAIFWMRTKYPGPLDDGA